MSRSAQSCAPIIRPTSIPTLRSVPWSVVEVTTVADDEVVAGPAPLSVYLGEVSGVQLEINNHAVAIGPQFVRGDVARFEAGADGVLRRGPRP